MRRKSKAQIFLERAELVETIVQNKLLEQRQWHELALSITANMGSEKVQSSGSKSKMSDAVDKCIDIEEVIARQVDRLIKEKTEIVSVLEQLDNPTEYNVLHKRFIQYKSLQEIADDYGKEYGWATTTLGRAMVHVAAILDKRKEVCGDG